MLVSQFVKNFTEAQDLTDLNQQEQTFRSRLAMDRVITASEHSLDQ